MHGEDVDTENTFVTERFFSLYYLRVTAVACVFFVHLTMFFQSHGLGMVPIFVSQRASSKVYGLS